MSDDMFVPADETHVLVEYLQANPDLSYKVTGFSSLTEVLHLELSESSDAPESQCRKVAIFAPQFMTGSFSGEGCKFLLTERDDETECYELRSDSGFLLRASSFYLLSEEDEQMRRKISKILGER